MEAYTITDLEREFPDDAACLEFVKNERWPDGITCENCQRVTLHHRIAKRRAYACDNCGHHVYPLAGTPLEKSTTSLRLWFYAMYLMGSTRTGISAAQLQRELGVTYKTAWRMFKQIRSALEENPILSGSVEADETYIGGRTRGGKRGRGAPNKTIVAGVVQRQGKVIARKVPDVTSATLVPFVRTLVLDRSTIYTDELLSYRPLGRLGYFHKRIQHSARVYVDGDIHTNTIEGFWSLVKNGLRGVYHSVSAKYLQSYLNECSFRFNRRATEEPMFLAILTSVLAAR